MLSDKGELLVENTELLNNYCASVFKKKKKISGEQRADKVNTHRERGELMDENKQKEGQ